jgi:hypothetical protein
LKFSRIILKPGSKVKSKHCSAADAAMAIDEWASRPSSAFQQVVYSEYRISKVRQQAASRRQSFIFQVLYLKSDKEAV